MKIIPISITLSLNLIILINADLNYTSIEDNTFIEIVPCVIKLAEKYFRSLRVVQGSLVIISLTPDDSTFQMEILKAFNEDVRHEYSVMMKYAKRPHANASHVTEKAKNYFFIIKRSTELPAIITQLKKLPTKNTFAQLLVLFAVELESPILEQEVIAAISYLDFFNMHDFNIMYPVVGTNKMRLVTWMPYEDDNCGNSYDKITLRDECDVVIETDEVTGVNKMSFKYLNPPVIIESKLPQNFHGCPMRVATSVWEPYVNYDEIEGFNKGLEVLMLKTYAEQHNITILFDLNNKTRSNAVNNYEFYQELFKG